MDDDRSTPARGLATDTSPLGRPAEEVEAESGNRVNPDTPRERVPDTALPPIPVLGGSSETPIAAGGTTGLLLDEERGADTVRRDAGQGDEPTENDQA